MPIEPSMEPAEANQPEPVPAYEQLLNQAHGADKIANYRANMAAPPAVNSQRPPLSVGAVAPPFALADTAGAIHALHELHQDGPLVLIFYRGGWCPFCNVHLRAFQLARTRLRALKTKVVLVSPQRSEQSLTLAEQQALIFPLLADSGNMVARAYGLVFQIEPALREEYRADGVDLAAINGNEDWELPMPATFVIDRAGLIRYAFVNADYTHRAEPADVLAVLQRLASQR